MMGLWVPKIAFVNALGPFQTTVDELSNGILVREGDPMKEDITFDREGAAFLFLFYNALLYYSLTNYS